MFEDYLFCTSDCTNQYFSEHVGQFIEKKSIYRSSSLQWFYEYSLTAIKYSALYLFCTCDQNL